MLVLWLLAAAARVARAQSDRDLRIVAPSGLTTSTWSATITSGRLEIFYNGVWSEYGLRTLWS